MHRRPAAPFTRGTPLQGLTKLQSLDLTNTPIVDVTPLQGLTNLQTLNLKGTNVTEKEIEALRAALPKLEILQ